MSEEDKNKQQKVGDDSPFNTVGSAVEQLGQEEVDENGLKTTSAADAEGHPVQEIESLCMNCHESGVTKLLMTRIPYFREVVIMSFLCDHCGFKNSEIQPAGQIQDKGTKHTFKVEEVSDLGRQVIKSETASCKFAELDIEIPPKRGQLTTIEGLLSQVQSDLSSDQPVRKHVDPEGYEKVEGFLQKVSDSLEGKNLPLTFTLDDPTGNSWIDYVPGDAAQKWSHIDYFRTKQQNIELGITQEDVAEAENQGRKIQDTNTTHRNPSAAKQIEKEEKGQEEEDNEEIENLHSEVQEFTGVCPACGSSGTHTRMKAVDIPYFKEVIIMSTVCHECGYKSNDVKTGGAVPEKGRKITLKVDDPDDLSRDILKSESCGMHIPELNLDLVQGTLGGRFTTLEGILRLVYEELESRVFNEQHDSMDDTTRNNWKNFLAGLQSAFEGKSTFTVILVDPLAGSYIQNVFAPDDDPNMTIEDYERTEEENEEFGLNDIQAE